MKSRYIKHDDDLVDMVFLYGELLENSGYYETCVVLSVIVV